VDYYFMLLENYIRGSNNRYPVSSKHNKFNSNFSGLKTIAVLLGLRIWLFIFVNLTYIFNISNGVKILHLWLQSVSSHEHFIQLLKSKKNLMKNRYCNSSFSSKMSQSRWKFENNTKNAVLEGMYIAHSSLFFCSLATYYKLHKNCMLNFKVAHRSYLQH
jgi:hypothetical protein